MRSFKNLRELRQVADRLRGLYLGGMVSDRFNTLQRQETSPMAWGQALNGLSEMVIGSFPLPLSVVPMVVSGRERIVPLVTEERGVVAGIAKAAKMAGPKGFTVGENVSTMRAVALIADVDDRSDTPPWPREYENHTSRTIMMLEEFRTWLIREHDPFRKYGGGLFSIKARRIGSDVELLLSCHTGEAMGARRTTELAEHAGRAFVERWGGTLVTAIVANNASGRFAFAQASWNISAAMPLERAKRIELIAEWAKRSAFRVDTHNKGAMNGVEAAATAFGQDTRAIYAANVLQARKEGDERPLSWFRVKDQHLEAGFDPFIPCATVGGATQHPMAVECRKLAGIEDAADLAAVIAACGLAANFASLLQLSSTEGFSDTYRRLAR